MFKFICWIQSKFRKYSKIRQVKQYNEIYFSNCIEDKNKGKKYYINRNW